MARYIYNRMKRNVTERISTPILSPLKERSTEQPARGRMFPNDMQLQERDTKGTAQATRSWTDRYLPTYTTCNYLLTLYKYQPVFGGFFLDPSPSPPTIPTYPLATNEFSAPLLTFHSMNKIFGGVVGMGVECWEGVSLLSYNYCISDAYLNPLGTVSRYRDIRFFWRGMVLYIPPYGRV